MVVDRRGALVATVEASYVLFVQPDQVALPKNRCVLDRLADVLRMRPVVLYRSWMLAGDHPQNVVTEPLTDKQVLEFKKFAKKLVGASLDGQNRVVVQRSALMGEGLGLFFMLADRLNLRADDLVEAFQRNVAGHRLITPIAYDLTAEQAARVAESSLDLPGVTVQVRQMRRYADPVSLSHLLGYVGSTRNNEVADALKAEGREVPEYAGVTGIEKEYDRWLSGQAGTISWRSDARGRPVSLINDQDPVPGSKVELAVDLNLQRLANRLLAPYKAGSVVAIDVKTGDVLTMASTPSYNLLAYWGGDDEALADLEEKQPLSPMVFRALSTRKAPGSSFKVVTTLAAALAGKFHPEATITCPGYFLMSDGRKLRCENHAPNATLDFHGALAKSCNTYFATMAKNLKTEDLFSAFETLGLTQKTGIDLPGEYRGLRISEKSFGHTPPKVFDGDRAQLGIGQGLMAVTPLQMVMIASLVANKGWEPTPHVVRSVTDPATGQRTEVKPERRLAVKLPNWVWNDLWSAMQEVVNTGTGQAAKAPYGVAGKTGSAEELKNKPTHSWFIAFAPTESRPEIALCVMVEQGGHGGTTAAPIAASWLDAYMKSHSTSNSDSARVEVSRAAASPTD
jgi:penicillin-binding protein 2